MNLVALWQLSVSSVTLLVFKITPEIYHDEVKTYLSMMEEFLDHARSFLGDNIICSEVV